MRKKKKRSRNEMNRRRVTCDFCGKEHYVMAGKWVANGNKHILYYDETGGCFDKVWRMQPVDSL